SSDVACDQGTNENCHATCHAGWQPLSEIQDRGGAASFYLVLHLLEQDALVRRHERGFENEPVEVGVFICHCVPASCSKEDFRLLAKRCRPSRRMRAEAAL